MRIGVEKVVICKTNTGKHTHIAEAMYDPETDELISAKKGLPCGGLPVKMHDGRIMNEFHNVKIVNQIATPENVTCKKCLKMLESRIGEGK